MSHNHNVPLGFVLGLVGVVIFGATLPASVFALEHYGPFFIASARAVVAGLLGLAVLVLLGRKQPFALEWRLPLAGAMVTFGFPAFSAVAMTSVPASDGGVVLGILPLATAMFAAILTAERPGAQFWFWALAGSALVIWFVVGQDGGDLRTLNNPGYIWLFLSAVSAAFGYVLMGRLSRAMAGWEVICRVLVACLPFNIVLTIALWQPAYWTLNPVPTLALGYHAVFSMFLGFFAWNAGLALGGIARVGQIQLLQIFVTVGLSAWLLDEAIGLRTLAFAAAVAATVWFGSRARIG